MNRINFLNLKLSSGRLVIVANVLEIAELAYANITKKTSLPRNLALETFGKLLIVS